jgi:YegS/Rv2252/BmrU family lipid kinase
MRIKLIGNPTAGREVIRRIRRAENCLRESGAEVHTLITEKRGDAEAWAKKSIAEGFDRIVVAGGDGTINEVINGIAGSTISLGIIPLGVSNVLALELGLPMKIENASETALTGKIKSVPLGIAEGRYFSLMVGVGFDAEVVCRLNLRLKRYLGKLIYILAGLKLILKYKPHPIDIIIENGEVLKGYSAIIGKSKFYGGEFTVTPEAGIEKEEINLCLFQKGRRRDIFRYIVGVVTGNHLRFKDVIYRKVRALKITSQGRVPVQIDGDCFGELPINISLMPEAVKLIFPKSP